MLLPILESDIFFEVSALRLSLNPNFNVVFALLQDLHGFGMP
jgi:hypothetical protein